MGKHVIGIDCGSGSVRAGLFELESGKLLRTAVKDIQINNPEANFYEQSTEDIWNAVVTTVKVRRFLVIVCISFAILKNKLYR